jgi:hypothetical protein
LFKNHHKKTKQPLEKEAEKPFGGLSANQVTGKSGKNRSRSIAPGANSN